MILKHFEAKTIIQLVFSIINAEFDVILIVRRFLTYAVKNRPVVPGGSVRAFWQAFFQHLGSLQAPQEAHCAFFFESLCAFSAAAFLSAALLSFAAVSFFWSAALSF